MPDRWTIDFPPDPRHPRSAAHRSLQQEHPQGGPAGDRAGIRSSSFSRASSTLPPSSDACRCPGGVSTAEPGQLRVLRPRRPVLHDAARLRLGRAVLGPDRLQAQDLGPQGDGGPEPQLPECRGAQPRHGGRARRAVAPPGGLLAGGGLRRGQARRPRALLRLRLGARGHPALRVRLPRPRLQRLQPGRAPFRERLPTTAGSGTPTYFDLLEKETNSELNTFEKREQKVAIANVFRQDTFALGYTLSASFHWSKDEANFHYDTNGVLARPAPGGAAPAPRGGVEVRGGRGRRALRPDEPLPRPVLRLRDGRAERDGGARKRRSGPSWARSRPPSTRTGRASRPPSSGRRETTSPSTIGPRGSTASTTTPTSREARSASGAAPRSPSPRRRSC